MVSTDAPVEWLETLRKRHSVDSSGFYDFGLIVYGSLLHHDEIRSVFRHPPRDVIPVKIRGFSRRFNKWVSEHLRKPQGHKAAVLNLRPENQWFNGLLITRVSRSGLEKYASREREYDLTQVPRENVDTYPESPGRSDQLENTIYTCFLESGEYIKEEIEPIPSYVDVCLEGARQQGETFYRDFLETTWTRGETLRSYLNGSP